MQTKVQTKVQTRHIKSERLDADKNMKTQLKERRERLSKPKLTDEELADLLQDEELNDALQRPPTPRPTINKTTPRRPTHLDLSEDEQILLAIEQSKQMEQARRADEDTLTAMMASTRISDYIPQCLLDESEQMAKRHQHVRVEKGPYLTTQTFKGVKWYCFECPHCNRAFSIQKNLWVRNKAKNWTHDFAFTPNDDESKDEDFGCGKEVILVPNKGECEVMPVVNTPVNEKWRNIRNANVPTELQVQNGPEITAQLYKGEEWFCFRCPHCGKRFSVKWLIWMNDKARPYNHDFDFTPDEIYIDSPFGCGKKVFLLTKDKNGVDYDTLLKCRVQPVFNSE